MPRTPRFTVNVIVSALVMLVSACATERTGDSAAVVGSEFIYERAPFPSAHASTVVQTGAAIVAAWFGGTAEGDPDVGIWSARYENGRWSAPVEIADGAQPDGNRYPCWNPVLFQPAGDRLALFYKVGPNPRQWWGMAKISPDSGRTWSAAVRLPDGILGPIRAKPVELPDRTLLCGSSTEHAGWIVHMERYIGQTTDSSPAAPVWTPEMLASGAAWQATGPLNDSAAFGAIQPTILVHTDGRLQILCRSQQGVITQVWSDDSGRTWGPMTATALPNPNAGIDAVRLRDGRFLLVCNPVPRGREKLALAVSADGLDWRTVLTLEDAPGEYSYPAMIQTNDGLIHLTYTWKRQRIKHVVIDPARLE